jgi:hypothetical protein
LHDGSEDEEENDGLLCEYEDQAGIEEDEEE